MSPASEIAWHESGERKSLMTAIYMPCEIDGKSEHHQQIYREIFNSIDLNGDGCIRIGELKQFLRSNDSADYPKGICTMILKMADENKDGIISFDEFIQLCDNTPAGEILTNNFFEQCTKMISAPLKSHFLPKSEFLHEYQMMRYKTIPLLIISMCAIQVLFFVNDQIHIKGLETTSLTLTTFSDLSSAMLFKNDRKIELWRFLTYMFVQKDYFHISSNVVMQLFTGIPLEAGHGCWRILVVFLASVLAGSMSIAALSICPALVGASAGAYGLLGAHFSTIILNWHEMEYRVITLFIIVIYVLVDVFLWVTNPIIGLGNSTITHAAGFVAGFLIGVVCLRNLQVKSWETRLKAFCLGIYIVLMVIQMFLILFVPDLDVTGS